MRNRFQTKLSSAAPAVKHLSDRELLPVTEGASVRWVSDTELTQAIRHGERTGGRIQAWIATEAAVVRELRRLVVDELGVARDDLHAAAYWKAGRSSTETDALLLQRYRRAAEAGGDVSDPDVRERVEMEI